MMASKMVPEWLRRALMQSGRGFILLRDQTYQIPSILNSLIEEIVEECIKRDNQLIFRYDVDKKIAPGYYNFIKNPICLEKMK